MGSSHHLKRIAMPRSWPLPRKTTVWVTRPRAGGHALNRCMALGVVLRDVIGVAHSSREARVILHDGAVQIDGRIVRDIRQGVGLMDVLTLGEQNYRCVLDERGKLRYRPISKKDAAWKPCRIENKTTIKGGLTQLNLHDGRNIIVEDGSLYSTRDTLRISLPEQKILDHIPFTDGASVYLTGGSHVGATAAIKESITTRSSMPNEIVFDEFSTIEDHVFIIAKKTPLPGIEVSA